VTIEFKIETLLSRVLNPLSNFDETQIYAEIRTDPLTGRTSLVHSFGRESRRWSTPRLNELIEKSLAGGCPFCPSSIDQLTPKFTPDLLPEGRFHLGECYVFPQVIPYANYSAVTVLSSQHFMSLTDFTQEILTDGFSACQAFLKRVFEYDPEVKHCYITWNYMPSAGGSLIHPHLQPHAEYTPSNYLRELTEASRRYYELNQTNFWSDLIAKEVELGERYIGAVGDISWLSTFAPKGLFIDLTAVFQGKNSILDLSPNDFDCFSQGLKRILSYMSDQSLYSFNLALYSGVKGEDYFWTHARIVSRFTHHLDSSDIGCTQLLLDEPLCVVTPEDTCRELKEYFRTSIEGE